jgi:predicted RNA-binding protein Jag
MKSMLLEASSVLKAVEKAWADSGKPREFTIKILEEGEKNFLGFSKRPAIVSIAFDPKKVPVEREKTSSSSQHATKWGERGRSDQQRNTGDRGQKKEFGRLSSAPARPVRERTFERTENKRPFAQESDFENWTEELGNDVKVVLKEAVSIMGGQETFTTRLDKKMLMISFNEPLCEKAEDERQLFASLSYMLIQILKKKHKKKFKGYHIILNSKRHGSLGRQEPLVDE